MTPSAGYYYINGAVTETFAKMCYRLAEALGTSITEDQVRTHAQLLGDIPLEELRVAFRRASDELERGFYPTPGKLRGYVRATIDDAALLAWTAFGLAAGEVGAYASLTVEDGAAAEALEMVFGSWETFCGYEDGPALGQRRAEFLAAYREARRHGVRPPRRLAGACESGGGMLSGDARTWQARLTDGWRLVSERPGLRQLGSGGDGDGRHTETRTEATGEGEAEAPGAGREADGEGGGGGA